MWCQSDPARTVRICHLLDRSHMACTPHSWHRTIAGACMLVRTQMLWMAPSMVWWFPMQV